jgi:hypothetical protein
MEDAMTVNDSIYSTMVRAGRTTYFVDLKEAKNGNMSISESRIDAEKNKKRTTLRVFGDSIDQFRQAIDEAASAVSQ